MYFWVLIKKKGGVQFTIKNCHPIILGSFLPIFHVSNLGDKYNFLNKIIRTKFTDLTYN